MSMPWFKWLNLVLEMPLPPVPKLVATVLASHADADGWSYPKVDRVAQLASLSTSQTYVHLKYLERCEVIERGPLPTDRRRKGTRLTGRCLTEPDTSGLPEVNTSCAPEVNTSGPPEVSEKYLRETRKNTSGRQEKIPPSHRRYSPPSKEVTSNERPDELRERERALPEPPSPSPTSHHFRPWWETKLRDCGHPKLTVTQESSLKALVRTHGHQAVVEELEAEHMRRPRHSPLGLLAQRLADRAGGEPWLGSPAFKAAPARGDRPAARRSKSKADPAVIDKFRTLG